MPGYNRDAKGTILLVSWKRDLDAIWFIYSWSRMWIHAQKEWKRNGRVSEILFQTIRTDCLNWFQNES